MESWNSVSSCSAVLCQNTECCYLTISIKHGSLETSVHVGFPSVQCSSTVFVVGLFIYSSALTVVFCSTLLSVASSAIHVLELYFFDNFTGEN